MPTAFITGASRGIGRGIAIALAETGHDIAALATNADPANTEKGLYETAARVIALGRRFTPILGDISDLDAHARIVEEAIAGLAGIDLFVSNAGVAPLKRMDILDTTPESFDRVMNINLRGAFFLAQRVANHFIARVNSGHAPAPRMVFITSISADTASPNRAEYCISKAGLAMTAQNFAVRLAEYGINVFDIRPGITMTDMTAGVKERYDTLIEEEGLLLQARWGTPEDTARAVCAIASGALDYSTGAVIEIGGGFGVKRL
jgi:3-oxoacyl-[acyl-carrier protein] reductase